MMAMAREDVEKTKSTELQEARARYAEHVVNEIAAGKRPGEVAMALAKGDKKKASSHRRRIRRLMYQEGFQKMIVQAAKTTALVESAASMPAVGRRAQRGRVDAARFLAEVSGLHNPKVNHEHSGEVSVKFVAVPRPELTKERQGALEEPMVDADVVE